MLDIGRGNLLDLEEGVHSRIMPVVDGCWLWTGSSSHGYGRYIFEHTGYVYAHRYVWEYLIGPIPDGIQIDHKCRQRLCVNPDHLQLLTLKEHIEVERQRRWMDQEFCVNGHLWNEENTHIRRNGTQRICLVCNRIRIRLKRKRQETT